MMAQEVVIMLFINSHDQVIHSMNTAHKEQGECPR